MNLESGVSGDFWVLQNTKSWELSGGFAPWTPTNALPWTCWGAYSAPRPPAEEGSIVFLTMYLEDRKISHSTFGGGVGVIAYI